MRLNRRGFLGALGAAIAGATLDPERALWIPSRKLISVPAPLGTVSVMTSFGFFTVGDIITFGTDLQRFRVMAVHPSGHSRVDFVRA